MHIQLNESKQLSKANLNKLKEGLAKKNVVMLLHANWCFWCKQFKPEWDKLANNLKGGDNLSVLEIEEAQLTTLKQKDQGLFEQLIGSEGLGFPTVLLFKGGQRYTYKGQRTSAALQAHLDSFLSEEGNETDELQKPRKPSAQRQEKEQGAQRAGSRRAAAEKASKEAKGMKSLDAAINMIIKKHFSGSS